MKKNLSIYFYLAFIVINIFVMIFELFADHVLDNFTIGWAIYSAEPFVVLFTFLFSFIAGMVHLIVGIVRAATKKPCGHHFIRLALYAVCPWFLVLMWLIMAIFSYGSSV